MLLIVHYTNKILADKIVEYRIIVRFIYSDESSMGDGDPGVTLISSAVDLITGRVIGMPTDDPLFSFPLDTDTPCRLLHSLSSTLSPRTLSDPNCCIFIDDRLLYVYVSKTRSQKQSVLDNIYSIHTIYLGLKFTRPTCQFGKSSLYANQNRP